MSGVQGQRIEDADVFICFQLSEAGDACNLMAEKLFNRGIKVMSLDHSVAGNLSERTMNQMISHSKTFLLFLTKSVFASDFVKKELEVALDQGKPIILVHESDPNRPGFANFSHYIETAPDFARGLFDVTESIVFQRRPYLSEPFYDELIRRIREYSKEPDSAEFREALEVAAREGRTLAWERAKIMIVGQGASGKTSTLRSILGEPYIEDHLTTEVADVIRTHASDWTALQDDKGAFDRQWRKAASQELVRMRFKNRNYKADVAEDEIYHSGPLLDDEEVARRIDLTKGQETKLREDADSDLSFTIWDYGGQEVFYALHHIFLTESGVYLVVFNIRQLAAEFHGGLEHDESYELLCFWLNSIHLHAPKAPIILVGTHRDQVEDDSDLSFLSSSLKDSLTGRLSGARSQIKFASEDCIFFAIDNSSSDPDRAEDLRSAIAKEAAKDAVVKQKVPLAWLKVHEDFLSSEKKYYFLRDIVGMTKRYSMSQSETMNMLRYFHQLGVVVFLEGTTELSRIVVTDPQWLLDKLSGVITNEICANRMLWDLNSPVNVAGLSDAYVSLRERAIASRSLLECLWSTGEDTSVWTSVEVEFLIAFMQKNLLLCPWKFHSVSDEEYYLITGLLTDTRDGPEVPPADIGLTCVLDFSSSFLPNGIYHRLAAQSAEHAAGIEDSFEPVVGNASALLSFGFDPFYLRAEADKLFILVRNDAERKAHVLKVLISMFRLQLETLFKNLTYSLILVGTESGALVPYNSLVSEDGTWDSRRDGQSVWADENGERVKVSREEFKAFFDDSVGPLDRDKDGSNVRQYSIPKLRKNERHHIFLSHYQRTGAHLAGLIAEKLKNRGVTVWLDRSYTGELNQEAMLTGVRFAKVYLLILTRDIFTSNAVYEELSHARKLKKKIVLVHESQTNLTSYADFHEYIEGFKKYESEDEHFWLNMFNEKESLAIQHKYAYEEVFYNLLLRRCFPPPSRKFSLPFFKRS